jgi:hypothetical protein
VKTFLLFNTSGRRKRRERKEEIPRKQGQRNVTEREKSKKDSERKNERKIQAERMKRNKCFK